MTAPSQAPQLETTAPEDRARALFEQHLADAGFSENGIEQARRTPAYRAALRAIQAALAPHMAGREALDRIVAKDAEHEPDLGLLRQTHETGFKAGIRWCADIARAALTLPVPSGDGVHPAPDVREAALAFIRAHDASAMAPDDAALENEELDRIGDLRCSLAALSTPTQALDATPVTRSAVLGWIIGDDSGERWRTWESGMPEWTDDPEKATRYARREDAEAVHKEDGDAWCVRELRSLITNDGEAE